MKVIEDRAHEILLKLIETDKTGFDAEGIAGYAYEIAEAMQAEAEKLKVKEEWQPDWSQAPEWAKYWTADELATLWWSVEPKFDSSESWHGGPTADIEKAPSFGYKGDWKDSLRKRP